MTEVKRKCRFAAPAHAPCTGFYPRALTSHLQCRGCVPMFVTTAPHGITHPICISHQAYSGEGVKMSRLSLSRVIVASPALRVVNSVVSTDSFDVPGHS